jgi:hypothetical protein
LLDQFLATQLLNNCFMLRGLPSDVAGMCFPFFPCGPFCGICSCSLRF